jgi:hypothetical protein
LKKKKQLEIFFRKKKVENVCSPVFTRWGNY